jgi:predicted dinucleotide-binding enzyme
MSAMVPIYVAAEITEAEEVRQMLAGAGIVSELEPVEEATPPPETGDGPCRVLVAGDDRDAALDVLRAEAAEADGEQW